MKRQTIPARPAGLADRLRQSPFWLICMSLWLLSIGLLLMVAIPEISIGWPFSGYQHLVLVMSIQWCGLVLIPLSVLSSQLAIQKYQSKRLVSFALLAIVVMSVCVEVLLASYSVLHGQMRLPQPLSAEIITLSEVLSWYSSQYILAFNSLKYLTCLALGIGLYWYEKARELSHNQKLMDKQLEASELALQRAQLNPHFLFNSLNSVSALVRTERKPQALEAISELSQLLRNIIDDRRREFSSLDAELNLVSHYMHLQKLRFGKKLQYEQQVSEQALQASVPVLLLLPLIENAIKHGSKSQCKIELNAQVTNGNLRINISNSVDDLPIVPGFGIGLSNNRARLELLYMNDFCFETDLTANQYVVAIRLPLAAETDKEN